MPAPRPPRTVASAETHHLDRMTFGKRLRAARKAFGWTLMQVAEVSGISITTISRAERGQLALSYERFSALARALQMDLAAMFSEAGATAAQLDGPVVTRAGKGVVYRGQAFSYEFLSTQAVGKQMSPIVGTVHARKVEGPQDYASHAGEEFVYLLSGKLEVHFETGHRVELGRGDALYFDSRIGHAYISTSRAPARIVGACTSESSLMRHARERAPSKRRASPPARAT
jgi:transcriptional regulator with XRE-family HTH domain